MASIRQILAGTALLGLCTLVPGLTGCEDGSDASNPGQTVTLANLNVLHGFDCAALDERTAQCRVVDRIALLREHLIEAGCPDLVTLQEVVNAEFAPTEQAQPLTSIVDLIAAQLPALSSACGFDYNLVYQPLLTVAVAEVDEELLLSRYRVLHTGRRNFFGPLFNATSGVRVFARHVLHARIDHPAGEVDVYTTHLASGSDLGGNTCGDACPAECDDTDTVRACQAEQLARYVEQTRAPDNLALISGDFNALPGSSEYASMQRRGWLDSHLAAGSIECDANNGLNCTSGRQSDLQDIENPALNVTRRIDYIFVAPPENGAGCDAGGAASAAAQVSGTYRLEAAGLFAAQPNPFSQGCGSLPDQPCWVSDHSGNHVRLSCIP